MKLLVFEYVTASGCNDPSLLAEGKAMLEGLLEDFQDLDVYYLISEKYSFPNYLEKWKWAQPVILKEDLKEWLGNNISKFDGCCFIAAEENLELYELTKIMEDNKVLVFGSNSNAVLNCSDKLRTHNILKDKLPVIKTFKINRENFLQDKNQDFYRFLFNGKKMVLKPADGVSCQGIKIINSWQDLKRSIKSIKTTLPHVLLQEYVEGEVCSVSLLSDGKRAVPLTLNLQKIESSANELKYAGAEVPWIHEQSKQALKIAKKAVEAVEGLKGFVGVDLIIGEKIYVVEINSRLTTPYVALRRLSSINLGQAILASVYGNLPPEIKYEGKIILEKNDHNLIIKEMTN